MTSSSVAAEAAEAASPSAAAPSMTFTVVFITHKPFSVVRDISPVFPARRHRRSGPFPGIPHRFVDATAAAPSRIASKAIIPERSREMTGRQEFGNHARKPRSGADLPAHAPADWRAARQPALAHRKPAFRRRCAGPAPAYGFAALLERFATDMARRSFENSGVNTRLAHIGNDPQRLLRLRQPAGRARLDRAFSRRGDDGDAGAEIHLRDARHADQRRACRGDRCARRLGRHDHRAVRACRRDHPAARLPVGRRPCADRRFGLRADAPLRQHDAEAPRRRGRLLRSACRQPASAR